MWCFTSHRDTKDGVHTEKGWSNRGAVLGFPVHFSAVIVQLSLYTVYLLGTGGNRDFFFKSAYGVGHVGTIALTKVQARQMEKDGRGILVNAVSGCVSERLPSCPLSASRCTPALIVFACLLPPPSIPPSPPHTHKHGETDTQTHVSPFLHSMEREIKNESEMGLWKVR